MKPDLSNGVLVDNIEQDFQFVPVSAVCRGIHSQLTRACHCCKGPCIFESLDNHSVRGLNAPCCFRMPIIYYRRGQEDVGSTYFMGKVVSGSLQEGNSLLIMPNKVEVKVVSIGVDDEDNLKVGLSGIQVEDIQPGSVLCSVEKPIPVVKEFIAQLHLHVVVDTGLFSSGYQGLLHTHSCVKEYLILELIQQIDGKTGKPMKKKPAFVLGDAVVICRIQVTNTICIEKYSDSQQFGRFTLLNNKGKAIGAGVVTQLA